MKKCGIYNTNNNFNNKAFKKSNFMFPPVTILTKNRNNN